MTGLHPGEPADLVGEQGQLRPSRDGEVMLDIGGNIGALIITTTPALVGAEIEVSPARTGATRTHVAVRERRGPSGSRYAAIYPTLPAGDYTIWDEHDQPADTVTITGGRVVELDWATSGDEAVS